MIRNRLSTTVYSFLAPFTGVCIQESEWKVCDIHRTDVNKFLLKYAVSIERRTFLVTNAELVDEDSCMRSANM